jgi:hypothetical protein
MTITHTRTKLVTAVVGAVITGAAAPALLFLGAGTAQAVQDSETVAIQDSEEKPDLTIGGFNPQPDPPGVIDPGSRVGIIDPGSRAGIVGPEYRVGDKGFIIYG